MFAKCHMQTLVDVSCHTALPCPRTCQLSLVQGEQGSDARAAVAGDLAEAERERVVAVQNEVLAAFAEACLSGGRWSGHLVKLNQQRGTVVGGTPAETEIDSTAATCCFGPKP